MKFSFPAIAAAVVVGITTAVFYGTPERAEAEYADVVINEYSEAAGMRPVVFPHWFHRVRFRCKVCHGDLGFQFKAGGNDINMVKIIDGQYCGACHDGDASASQHRVATGQQGPRGRQGGRGGERMITLRARALVALTLMGIASAAFMHVAAAQDDPNAFNRLMKPRSVSLKVGTKIRFTNLWPASMSYTRMPVLDTSN